MKIKHIIQFLFLLLAIIFIVNCQNKKPPEYSMLGFYSPYQNYSPERLIGKVEKVIQKGYWAIPDGDAFRKGNRVTIKERKSRYYDWEVIFDESGDVKTCIYIDENNKVLRKVELIKENNILTLATYDDSRSVYDKLKCNSEGDIIELLQFSTGVDTLMWRSSFKFSLKRDTLTNLIYDHKGILRAKAISLVDKDGQFSSRSYHDGNGIYQRGQEFEFNEKRNFIKGSSYNERKELTVDVYFSDFEYDQKGNWIKAIMVPLFVNEGDTVIWERTYTYFE